MSTTSPVDRLLNAGGLLKAGELAEILEEPKPTVYALAREKGMPCIRFGRAMRFDGKAVAEWLQAGGTASTGNGDG